MNSKNLAGPGSVLFYTLCLLWLFLTVFLGAGCASGQKTDKHHVRKIILSNLHYRRPVQRGANFNAEHLEADFESKPRPDHKLDCEPLKSLFTGLDLEAVRECLKTVNDEGRAKKITYKLRREITPFLELEEKNKETPPCFVQILKVLPVPREIYFQASEAGSLSCFNARIPLVKEDVLGLSELFSSTQLNLTFPKFPLPEGDEETILLLGTWVMAPFFKGGPFVESKLVPQSLCSTCFEGKGLFKETDVLPPFWP